MTTRPHPTTDARFTFDVLRADRPVLVDFHADWCRSCQLLDPVLDELAADRGDRIRVVKVDVEANPHTADRYGIKSIPTLILFDGGEERDRMVNVIRRKAIEDRLEVTVP
jgi:thioredoxin 1